MLNLKQLLGVIPSYAARRLIYASAPSFQSALYVEFINSRPNWFQAVGQRFLVKTRFGFSIWCDRFDVIGQAIIRNGQWEGLLSRTIVASLGPGAVAIDIGANIGYDTMLMSKSVGANGTVVAFEPDYANLERLLENLKQMPYSNVLVQSTGVGSENCIAQISSGEIGNAGTSNLRPNPHGSTKPLLVNRIDQLLPASRFRKVALVKIDIEGFEYEAIQGMGDLLNNVEVLTCEVDRCYLQQCGSTPEAIFDLMYAHGFTSYCAQPNSDGKWQRSGADYQINVKESHHFDALFCRSLTPELKSLIEI